MSRWTYLLGVVAITSGGVGGLQAANPPAPAPAPTQNTSSVADLKDYKGRDVVLAMCMPCHSAAVITASHRSRAGWDQTITKMQKQNGMWQIPEEIRTQLLDYLEATQPPSDPGLEKARETPWANPLYRPNPLW
jgi:hypothetical protein